MTIENAPTENAPTENTPSGITPAEVMPHGSGAGGRHRVVVVGGGFGGLNAVRELADADVDITLVDRTNHHLFQPLLYQVAAGILSPGLIAPALRGILKDQENTRTLLAEVRDIDLDAKVVHATTPAGRALD